MLCNRSSVEREREREREFSNKHTCAPGTAATAAARRSFPREEEEEEESLFKADAVNEEDPERDRAAQV